MTKKTHMMLVFIFALFCNVNAQAQEAKELSEGLIGYWPFDGGSSTAKDHSPNGNNGTVNGDPEYIEGHSGKAGDLAINFDGEDDSVTTEVSLLNDLEELTLSFWMNMPEQQTGGRKGLIGQNDAVEYGMISPTSMQYWTPAGNISVDFGPTTDDWTHVAVVVSSEGFKVYAGGEIIGTTSGGGPVSSGDTFNMGGDGVFDATGNNFLGSLDDVAVYNVALSDQDIADLASGAAVPILRQVPLIPDLIAYWPFDGDLADKVGNNDGEAQGTEDISYDDGQFGQGIALDGVDQFVQTPVENEETFDFQDGTGFSISAWYRVDEFTKSWQALIAKGEGNRWRIHRRGGEGQLTGNGGSGDVAGATGDINDGEIHHLVLVSDPENGEVHFYSDGELVSSGGAPALQSNDNPMMIGENPDARGRTWGGLIDDVGVFNRPITGDEVALIYNEGNGNPLMVGGVIIPKPKTKLASSMTGFSVELTDDENGSTVDAAGVSATFDGAALEVSATKADGVTTFSYETPALLEAGTEHFVVLTVKDTEGATHTIEKSFKVKPYTVVDAGSRAGDSLKGESGIVASITQISTGQNVGELHGNQIVNAEKQFNGWGNDPDTEEAYLNEADPDSFEGWSYYPVLVPVVNFDQDGGVQGNFNSNNGYDDEYIPNIPGWGDSTDGIVGEFTALLELKKGVYKLGVNSDDGFKATIGANFTDMLAQELGSFNGGRGAADTTFTIYVQEDGLYPYRVIWFEGGGGANVELFSFVDGEKVLINDPDVDGSIKAYALDGVTFEETTTDRVDTGRAAVISMSPANGDKLVKSGSIELVVKDGSATTVDQSSAAISLNGEAVDAKVSKDGDTVIISYAPEGGLPVGSHTVSASFKESNGTERSASWSFYVPGVYSLVGEVPSEAQGFISVREYHGIGTTAISTLMADADFPDNPNVNTVATYFEWPQSGDIEVNPAGNVRDNYGWHLSGFIHPPETGEYIFSVATDDNSQLWLSTDADPANAVQITNESQWQGVRNFQPMSDETTSAPVLLEAGNTYFIECFAKEGGGGDNMAVAWSLPSDEGMEAEAGALPISGDYLSPFTSAIDPEPTPLLLGKSPEGASPIAAGGKIELNFLNRGLDLTGVAVTVNGNAVSSSVAVDGKSSSITADLGDVSGKTDISVTYNGVTEEWSYLAHEPLVDGEPNPILYFDFDYTENSAKTWDHVFGYSGAISNAEYSDDTPTGSGSSIDLTDNANGNVFVSDGAAALNIAAGIDEVSVSFWQKNSSTPSTSSFWADPGRALQAHVPWSNGSIYWDTAGCCNGGTQRINADANDFGQDWTEWNHYVFIKSGSLKEIWINGELFLDGDNTSPLPTNINKLWIGAGANGGNSLRGKMDDFAVFASTLDEDQILSIYEGGTDLYPAKRDISALDVAPEAPFEVPLLIDFAGDGANSAGSSPAPWVSINNLVQDQSFDLGAGVSITALDDGFNPNNPAQPGEGATYDGISVPQEARNDYLFKIADAAGTSARMRIDGLPAGEYNVTVFEGRTTDVSQYAKIWAGDDEPATQNTGDFAKGSGTVRVTVAEGQSLWYKHLEDGSGGVSGMIINAAPEIVNISVARNADGTVTVTFDGTLQTAPTVNGPWTDVDAASPLTIPSSDAAAFGRAKK